jgi:hypothetical protein
MTDVNQTETIVDDLTRTDAAEAAGTAADEAAAFAAAFHESRGEEPPDNTDTRAYADESTAEAPAEAPVLAGFTEGQIKEMFGRLNKVDQLEQFSSMTRDQVFGKIGELNRTIQQLQSQHQGIQGLNAKQLKRLSEYDPDLANSLAEDLKGLIGPAQSGPSKEEIGRFVTGYVNDVVSRTVDQVSKDYEVKLLKTQHPDIGKIYRSPDFNAWMAAQDADTRRNLETSFDAGYISQKLNEFKSWRSSSKPQSNDKLRRAAMPNRSGGRAGSGGGSEEDAFLAGFKAVRGSGLR